MKLVPFNGMDELTNEGSSPSLQSVIEYFDNGSILFRTMLDALTDYTIQYDMTCENSYIKDKGIFIKYNQQLDKINFDVIKMLRTAWLIKTGNYPDVFKHPVNDHLRIKRFLLVDALTHAVRICYDCGMEKNSYKVYNWLFDVYPEMLNIVGSFVVFCKEDFRSLNNGQAMKYLFNALYLDSVLDVEDTKTIKNIMSNSDYITDQNKVLVTRQVLNNIGKLSYGKNYFEYMDEDHPYTMSDGIYMVINNRSNSNFLWFLRFEEEFNYKQFVEKVKLNDETFSLNEPPTNNVIEVDFKNGRKT